eukprot:11907973-Karenia_brevis.AAC.1
MVWDDYGVGGEVEEGEGVDEEDIVGEDPDRIRLQEDSEVVKKIGDPMLPSEQEVKEHYEMAHAVFRSWCGICVRTRSKEWDCNRDSGKERQLPECVWDYCFPGNE